MNTVQPIRSKTQVKDMADWLKSQNMRDYVMFMTGIYMGLRISDYLPLKVRDVRGRLRLNLREQKTGKEKIIEINKKLSAVYAEYTQGMEDWEYLFPSRERKVKADADRTVKPLTRQRAIQIIKRAAAVFGIESVGTHTLRKTFGYHLYQDTKDIATIQAIFNHSSPLITLRYIGVDQDKKDKLVRDISFD